MKKLFALLIILALGFSLCGCFAVILDEDAVSGIEQSDPKDVVDDKGNEPEDLPLQSEDGNEGEEQPDQGNEGEEQPNQGEEVIEPTDPDTPVENPDNNDVVIEGPVFATDWATNEIEEMLPNPPLGPWEKIESPDNVHVVATPLEAVDYSVSGRDRMALANYFAWLSGMGFTVEEVGYSSKDVIGAELPDHWFIIDQYGRVANFSIYFSANTKEGPRGYAIISFDLDSFGMDVGGSTEPYDPQPEDVVMDMDEVLSFLPQLPFTGWVGGHFGGNVYEYSVTGLNTSAATNPPDSGEPDGKDKDTFIGYLATLIGKGYDVVEVGNGYKWTVADSYGNFATFMIGDGGLFVTVERVADTPSVSEPDDTPAGGDASSISLPELPFGEWFKKDNSASSYDLIGTNVDEWEMCEVFIGDLAALGYDVFEIFYEAGLAYEYQAEKGNVVINIQGDIPNANAVIKVTVE